MYGKYENESNVFSKREIKYSKTKINLNLYK